MPLASLRLNCFRGYESAGLDLGPGLSLFVGDNAQGKTNLLRAVEVLGLGAVPGFDSGGGELVRWGSEAGSVDGRLAAEDGAAPARLLVGVGSRGLRLAVNGKSVPRTRWVGLCPVLFVGPEDRDQVTGPPSARRALLDELLEQGEPRYLAALREYRRALRQRNRALGDPESGEGEIEIWEEPMARSGGLLLAHRVRALDGLAPRAAAWHAELTGGGSHGVAGADRGLGLAYRTGVAAPIHPTNEGWMESLAAGLASGRERDRAAGTTLEGPHRDEVDISLAGRALKGSGSSGEIWTAILAFALASAESLGTRLGRMPILLFDDVLASLDRDRCDRVLGIASSLPQVLLSATGIPVPVPAAATWNVRGHALERRAGNGKGDAECRNDGELRGLLARC